MNERDRIQYERWLAQKPETIRNLAARFPIDREYLFKPTGARVLIVDYLDGDMLYIADKTLTAVRSIDLEQTN